MIVWITGLPCSGKTTLAYELHKRISLGRAVVIDAEDWRAECWPELGFEPQDRDKNVARLGYVARQFSQLGLVAIVAAVSPFRKARELVRNMSPRIFFEVYLDCPVEIRIARDHRDVFKSRAAKQWADYVHRYEPPEAPEVLGHTDLESVDELADRTIKAMVEKGLLHEH